MRLTSRSFRLPKILESSFAIIYPSQISAADDTVFAAMRHEDWGCFAKKQEEIA
jgi:hypothetical protein